jgi:hypothetical protein
MIFSEKWRIFNGFSRFETMDTDAVFGGDDEKKHRMPENRWKEAAFSFFPRLGNQFLRRISMRLNVYGRG